MVTITKDSDIQIVCRAILDNFVSEGQDGADYCRYCFTDYGNAQKFFLDKGKKLLHKLDCPCLVAQDLLVDNSKKNKQPSCFTEYPWSCVYNKIEYEIVAQNIMKILKRTGNKFRDLSWEEYETERIKDGYSPRGESEYFEKVISYCKSADTAKLFSKEWDK